MTRLIFVFACTLLLVPAAFAKGKAAAPAAPDEPALDAIDISGFKDKLQIITDGKGHYIVVDPWGDEKRTYYGDGKRFHAQRVSTSGRQGTEAWDRTFWEPRVNAVWKGGGGLRKGNKYTAQCGVRATEMQPVGADETAKILESASFYGPLWKYRPYALARDDKGTYYYVDRPREPENNKAFRLFSGKRGSMKPLKMTNIVSDSLGDIFITKGGELRLVLDLKKPLWVEPKGKTELSKLPVEDNTIMIYSDLGVYSGQRLGTPCDDLL
jgi:hypothetical protein